MSTGVAGESVMVDLKEGARAASSSASTWFGWAMVLSLLGIGGAALLAWGPAGPKDCSGFGGCEAGAGALIVFVVAAFIGVMPALPLFALSKVLDSQALMMKHLEDTDFERRRAAKRERDSDGPTGGGNVDGRVRDAADRAQEQRKARSWTHISADGEVTPPDESEEE
jgi:hypothetical protein